MMGGATNIINKGRELHDAGRYMEASEILNKLVFAEPHNQAGKDLLADVYEQIGYQQENPGLRNSFLQGALELRSGIPEGFAATTLGPDMVRAMDTGLFLDFLAIMMDSRKTDNMAFTINLVTPDNGEEYVIELSDNTLTNIEGYQAENADLTLTINRTDLEQVMTGEKTLLAQIEDGTAIVNGNVGILKQLAATMVHFEVGFEILPGTKTASAETDLNDFEVGPIANPGE
jgi:alkyl sulfatase BDS1-like metallo-beta-lactamase superfamily hydrolase